MGSRVVENLQIIEDTPRIDLIIQMALANYKLRIFFTIALGIGLGNLMCCPTRVMRRLWNVAEHNRHGKTVFSFYKIEKV